MFGGNEPQGFTIIEVMVFLTVSGLLFLAATIMIAGQQNKTEFQTGIRNTFSQLQDIATNVADGYYDNYNSFKCSASAATGGPLTFTSVAVGSGQQGQNIGCNFIGRVVQFAPTDLNSTQYVVYTVAGRQYVSSIGSSEVQNLDQAVPTVVSTGAANSEASTVTLPYQIQVKDISYTDVSNPGTPEYFSALGFFSTFAQYGGSSLESGSDDVDLVPVPANSGNTIGSSFTSQASTVSEINSLQNNGSNNVIQIPNLPVAQGGGSDNTVENPSGGVTICFKSTTDNEYATILIGGSGSSPFNMVLNTGLTAAC